MKRALRTLAFACAAVILLGLASATPAGARRARDPGQQVTDIYYRALLLNTPFVESTWDEQAGSYRLTDFYHVAVLGNAVLLKYGEYDEETAGVSAGTLRDHTLRTIAYAAARNRYVDPAGTWGRTIYWDSTMETYFVAAAKLLWDDLTDVTRSQIDTIIRSAADNIVTAGENSPQTNGLRGGHRGDTKMEEMGARTMPLATALAWLPDHPNAASWREWLTRWTTNMGGLPQADLANPALLNGRPVSGWNTARNVWDTFIVENHGSWNPIYQQSMGAYPGRNAAQYLLAGRPVPQDQLTPPNNDPLWATMAQTGMDSGVPQDFMVADRHHLYGRELLPVTARAVLAKDRYAAAAETMLAERLIPYVQYPPGGRLTKFSGEPKYEPEARAELAMAYLLHRIHGGVQPVSERTYFKRYTAVVDHGPEVGLLAHQSVNALAAAVTKPRFVKFAYHPQHDDWLFDSAGASPSFLPTTSTTVTGRKARAYTPRRDGFAGSASALTVSGGVVGFATLPDGSVVYASSGVAAGEGALRLHNMTMPGVPGLDGDRTFTWADGSATLPAADGDGDVDELRFPASQARYVRVTATEPGSQGCCALDEFEVYAGGDANRARGKPVSTSSRDPRQELSRRATDGNTEQRPAPVPDSGVPAPPPTAPQSITVDLGDRMPVDRVRLHWGHAYPTRYSIETSEDGQAWRQAAAVPTTRQVTGNWLNVDGRAGFIVRAGQNPISIWPAGATLSDGPATPLTVEAHPAETPGRTAARARSSAPRTDRPALVASLAGGQLSLFNLGGEAVTGATATLPQDAGETILYQGTQHTGSDRATRYDVSLDAADAVIAPARFAATGPGGTPLPAGLTLTVTDTRTVEVTNASSGKAANVRLRSLATGETVDVRVAPGATARATFTRGPLLPTTDLARGRITYPTSPLPAGMTDPARAVDGDPGTAWSPGPSGGRMVVDLGAVRRIGSVRPAWTPQQGSSTRVEISSDGVTYTPLPGQPVDARYVAVVATGPGSLTALSVQPDAAPPQAGGG